MENQMNLNINYKQLKFQHTIKFDLQEPPTFFDLKIEIYERLLEQKALYNEKILQFQIADPQNTQFVDTERIDSKIKNGDTIKVNYIRLPGDLPKEISKVIPKDKSKEIPKEAICILYDTSGSMAGHYFKENQLTRIGAAYSWFSAFADKTVAFGFNHVVQLICFSSSVNVRGEFTNNFDDFSNLLKDVQASGGTQLFDAIEKAIQNLLKIKQKYPNIILRIIALTDGEDSKSPQNLVKILIENKIIIDSFVVGEDCISLKTLTHASGGRCYCPKVLIEGMQLFEIETILSVERRDIENKSLNSNIDLNSLKDRPFDKQGIEQSNKEMKVQAEKLEVTIKKMEQQPASAEKKEVQRVLQEMKDFQIIPLQNVKIFPSKDNLFFWKALIIGPKGTAYNKGTYLISIQFPNDYPISAPTFRFQTKIYHCNVSQQGLVCIPILQGAWNDKETIKDIFNNVTTLLANPNPEDSVESSIVSLMMHERKQYEEKVSQQISMYASLDSNSLAKIILGEENQNADQIQNLKNELDAWMKENRA